MLRGKTQVQPLCPLPEHQGRVQMQVPEGLRRRREKVSRCEILRDIYSFLLPFPNPPAKMAPQPLNLWSHNVIFQNHDVISLRDVTSRNPVTSRGRLISIWSTTSPRLVTLSCLTDGVTLSPALYRWLQWMSPAAIYSRQSLWSIVSREIAGWFFYNEKFRNETP